MKPLSVICPHCKNTISLDAVMAHQIEEDVSRQASAKLEEEKAKWEQEEKQKLWKMAQEKAEEKILSVKNQELRLLKEENQSKDKALQDARQMELKLRQEKNLLEDQKRAFELQKQRQLDEAKKNLELEISKRYMQEHRLKDAEKDKQLESMRHQIEELQLKANLTSQQLQGEVLELEIEEALHREFPLDEIMPIAKGINGADIIQKVRDQMNRVCGLIVWESKRTKNWSESWVGKLKEDLMRVKGDVAVLITIALPDGVKNFGFRNGIYVASFESFISLAYLLRQTLIDQQKIKLSVVGKNEKMEMVYNYFLSNEFRQRISAIAEAFSAMKEDLENEKRVFAKLWAKREKEIGRVINNTASMHGDLQGLMGNSLPEVQSLSTESLLLGLSEEKVLS